MDKKIVLASAGAGKTYFIANDFLLHLPIKMLKIFEMNC